MKRNTQHDHYIESRTAEKSHISVCNPLNISSKVMLLQRKEQINFLLSKAQREE